MSRRGILALTLAVLLAGASVGWAQQKVRQIDTRIVVCTTTESHLASARTDRRDLTLQNAGTVHANVGMSLAGGFQGFTLHAGSSIEFRNFEAAINCRMATGSTAIEILEEFK